jgi:hypothetical protein
MVWGDYDELGTSNMQNYMYQWRLVGCGWARSHHRAVVKVCQLHQMKVGM